MASGRSSYACPASAALTNRWRGTVPIAASTRSSLIPRRTSCSSTMARRSGSKLTSSPAITTSTFSAFDRLVHEITHLPVDQLADEPRVRQVESQRRHRREPGAYSVQIRARDVRRLSFRATDPVVRPAPEVLAHLDLIPVDPPPEECDA